MLNPRRYLASPRAPGASRLELDGFPYAERGYTMGSQAARLYLPDRLRNKGQLTAPIRPAA